MYGNSVGMYLVIICLAVIFWGLVAWGLWWTVKRAVRSGTREAMEAPSKAVQNR